MPPKASLPSPDPTSYQKWAHLASGPAAPLIDHGLTGALLGLRSVLPVHLALVQIQREYRHVGDLGLVATGLQQQHRPVRVLCQPVDQYRAGRATAHHHKVVLPAKLALDAWVVLRIHEVVVEVGDCGDDDRREGQGLADPEESGPFQGACHDCSYCQHSEAFASRGRCCGKCRALLLDSLICEMNQVCGVDWIEPEKRIV